MKICRGSGLVQLVYMYTFFILCLPKWGVYVCFKSFDKAFQI